MTLQSEIRHAVCRAYRTALFLSGSAELAEAAVLKSIGLMNSEAASGEELFEGTVKAAISLESISTQRAGEPWPAGLPYQLRCILHLPRYPCQCFVLRILAGLPHETCARLLGSEIDQVAEDTRAAFSELRGLFSVHRIPGREVKKTTTGERAKPNLAFFGLRLMLRLRWARGSSGLLLIRFLDFLDIKC